MNDKRIGRTTAEKHEWPATTISGVAPYRKPCTMVSFGHGYFAVLDTFISPEDANTLILECQEIVNAELKPKRKASLDSNE